jgi:hypothetical protein
MARDKNYWKYSGLRELRHFELFIIPVVRDTLRCHYLLSRIDPGFAGNIPFPYGILPTVEIQYSNINK